MDARSTSLAALLVALVLTSPSAGHAQQVQSPTEHPAPGMQENVAVPSITVLGSKQAEGVLGKDVRSSAGENMGRSSM